VKAYVHVLCRLGGVAEYPLIALAALHG